MGTDDARHLLARTGFGPTEAEVRAYAVLTREQGVNLVLRDARSEAITPPPAFVSETTPLRYPRAEDTTPEQRRAFQQQQTRNTLELRAWWVNEMLTTRSPLTERMTLFWHNHFVSSEQKVRFARLMYAQNVTLRENALGNFATLLHAASKDPAMLIYLDTAQSRKGQPNENFAREVMELFTLGEGHYSERDIKEAARAFTGWSLDRDTGRYVFRNGGHDTGVKTVLGRSGNFDGDDVLDVILTKPQTSEFITAKLWREFVSPNPDPREVKRIAQIFRGQNYDIKVAMRALLNSDAFWAQQNRGTLVKSPIELVVGTLRQLDVAPTSAMPFAVVANGMGQNLFAPPNVKGWPGGEQWITAATLFNRYNACTAMVEGKLVAGAGPAFPKPNKANAPANAEQTVAAAPVNGKAVGNPRMAARRARLGGQRQGATDAARSGLISPAKLFPDLPHELKADQVVDAAVARFLQRPLHPDKRATLVAELGDAPLKIGQGDSDQRIADMICLLLSTPEYQVH